MSVDWMTALADKLDSGPKWNSPLTMATQLDSRVRRTPALNLVDDKLVNLLDTNDGRLTLSIGPQEGKSMLVSRRFPTWVLTQRPDTRIAIVSYEHNVARRLSRAIRDDITMHPELGLTIRSDLSAQHEWQLEGHEGGVYAVGVGGALTGRSVDLLILDDLLKDREQAESPTYRERAWNWWRDVGATRLSPGAPVVIVATRWHAADLTGKVLAAEDGDIWEEINIPAQADHRPEHGESDILGREPGEFLESARGRTRKQWEAIKLRSGPKTWASLFQGRPSPDEGGVFPPEEKWPRFAHPMWVEAPDGTRTVPGLRENGYELIQSWDLTFKDTKGSDFVVGQVWLRVGANAYLLDQVRDRMNFQATVAAIKSLSAKWPQASAKLTEDKANGPAVISALSQTVPGLIPVEPQGSKYARASAISPFTFAGNVHIPEASLLPSVGDLFEEMKSFPNSPNDDQVDGLSQALDYLLLHPMIDDSQLVAEEWQDDREWSISPY